MTADLLASCALEPENDAPRLVWADAVGGERGEFVVIQCALAKGDCAPERAGPLRRRQRELLETHGKAWSELDGIAKRVMFRRGFVEAVEMDCGRFADDWDAIHARAPVLRFLNATGLSSIQEQQDLAFQKLEKLFRSSAIRSLLGLYIVDAQHSWSTDPLQYMPGYFNEDAEQYVTEWGQATLRLAHELGVHHLRAFGASRSGGMDVLRETTLLRHVERLSLGQGTLDEIIGLLDPAITPALTALELTAGALDPLHKVIDHLPRGLRELRVTQFPTNAGWDVYFERLAQRCPGLERLTVENGSLAELSVLHAFGKLRELSLPWANLLPQDQVAAIDRFVARPLPALRELVVFANLLRPATETLLTALGPQLEYVNFDYNPNLAGQERDLEDRVAGVLRPFNGYLRAHAPLLHTDRDLDTVVQLS